MLPGITLDSEHSRDLDDAVWAVEEGDCIRLWIAIAAVTQTVEPHSPAMQQALVWLESRYRGSRCIRSMLSPHLTKRHSLLPERERPVVVLELLLQADGSIQEYCFREDVLLSHGQLSYDTADRILAGREDSPFALLLETLARGTTWLDRGRQGVWGHAIAGEFRDDIGQTVTGSRQLIASTAIAYNALVAEQLTLAGLPGMYRVQDIRGVEEFATLLDELGEDAEMLAPLVAHQLPRAEHRPRVAPHWALKLPGYARASSPLRRVEDLINQQQLLAALAGKRSRWSETVLEGVCERIEDRVLAGEAKQRERMLVRMQKPLDDPISLGKLTANQFAGLLERVGRSGKASEALERSIEQWLQEGRLTPRHAAVILSQPFDLSLRRRVLDAIQLEAPTLNSISVLNVMEQIGLGAVDYVCSGSDRSWVCRVTWQALEADGVGSSKSEARSQAARALLELVCEREDCSLGLLN
ncbi:RNB domain-containing ribonuclease [Synechococcus sp. PCC 7336]|uniref:RNB domain-containing ribonuclease n=1 Tax=Synechococcus sp. PCC 7336 TaxID=195250 RepID=UPI000344A041|nr:RNB domain-containing ribonuclease [Synechococcus sp. PCC 7336]